MRSPSPPRATYRIQFGPDFRFRDALRRVPYLARLGVSHLYASPIFAARPGSSHGYDVVDPRRLNPELGTEEDFLALVEALQEEGMGLILDFVPNHMGVGIDNPWWADTLEWGAGSAWARYFDIDWTPPEPSLHGKLLLPVLGDRYGQLLHTGELRPSFDAERGTFVVRHPGGAVPLCPREYPDLLRDAAQRHYGGGGELEALVREFPDTAGAVRSRTDRIARSREIDRIKEALAEVARSSAGARGAMEEAAQALAGVPGRRETFGPLHELLERQAYRLAYWRVAADEINYRRFFDIDDLAGLRVEDDEVFRASHGLVRDLLEDGRIQGLRLDHVDGLRDPDRYLRTLRGLAREVGASPYVVVEKILAPEESLPKGWAVEGTTGYDFLADAHGLQVDPRGREGLDRTYARFTGTAEDFEARAVEAKRSVMSYILASELHRLAGSFSRIAKRSAETRDFTFTGLRRALADLVAHFPVYRTYVTRAGPGEADRRHLDRALEGALDSGGPDPGPDPTLYHFIRDVITLDLLERDPGAYRRREVEDASFRFQQYTGPVMAKSVEDTAFYRYLRLISLNEVGSEPYVFGVSPEEFHEANGRRLADWPRAMVTTATHDHKRGEDVRARLAVLSERPRDWHRAVRRWRRVNRHLRRDVRGRESPSAHDEYLLYQTLVGSWPPGLQPSSAALAGYRDRVNAYALKAAREAKLRTSWRAPDPEYEKALSAFVEGALDPNRSAGFLPDIQSFVEEVAPVGVVNSLVQLTLKLTVPGVPDLYQGTERWDLSLVDPDNRRPVDYDGREDALTDAAPAAATPGDWPRDRSAEEWDDLLAVWEDGRVKQRLLEVLLALRTRRPRLVAEGSYEPAPSHGDHTRHVVAFHRKQGREELFVAVARLPWPLRRRDGTPGVESLEGTALSLPPPAGGRPWRDVLTGQTLSAEGRKGTSAAELFRTLPVAILEAGPDPDSGGGRARREVEPGAAAEDEAGSGDKAGSENEAGPEGKAGPEDRARTEDGEERRGEA